MALPGQEGMIGSLTWLNDWQYPLLAVPSYSRVPRDVLKRVCGASDLLGKGFQLFTRKEKNVALSVDLCEVFYWVLF